MADLKHKPVTHNHAEFLAAARQRPRFNDAYGSLELEYTVASLAQSACQSWLDARRSRRAHGHNEECNFSLGGCWPSRFIVGYLKKYAAAVGCDLQVKFVPQKVA